MGNLFMCGATGGQKTAITRTELTSIRGSKTAKMINVIDLLPEGIDYRLLTVDNFSISKIKLIPVEVEGECSAITPDIPFIYAMVKCNMFAKIQSYSNGILTISFGACTLEIGDSGGSSVNQVLATKDQTIDITIELVV